MFTQEYKAEYDELLVQKSIDGDKSSLEQLIKRHQDYLYNISLKFFLNPDDAMDATQEVLIKVVTSLKTFKGKSQFRTWLYRIALNHFLNMPKKKIELVFELNPETYAGFEGSDNAIEVSENEKEEVRIMCSTAMLMCLDREQRLIYIIGEIFGANHLLGAELFDTTPANYRVKLYRAKTDLLNFASGKCGLISESNPCRCQKKTKSMIAQGMVDRENLLFNTDYKQKIKELVSKRKDEVSDKIQLHMKELFGDSPFQIKTELNNLIEYLIK